MFSLFGALKFFPFPSRTQPGALPGFDDTNIRIDVNHEPAPVDVVPNVPLQARRPSNVSWVAPPKSSSSYHEPSFPANLGRSASSPTLATIDLPRPELKRFGSTTHLPSQSAPAYQGTNAPTPFRVDGYELREPLGRGMPASFPRSGSLPSAVTLSRDPAPPYSSMSLSDDRDSAPSPSSAYSAFIRRPVRRSASQASSIATFITPATGAPALPPLTLGPAFAHGLPHAPVQTSPLRTHFVVPPVLAPPASLSTHRRMSDVSEEADAQSFVTAHDDAPTPAPAPSTAFGRVDPLAEHLVTPPAETECAHAPGLPPLFAPNTASSILGGSTDSLSLAESPMDQVDLDPPPPSTTALSTTLVGSTPPAAGPSTASEFTATPRPMRNEPSALELYHRAAAAVAEEARTDALPRARVRPSTTSSCLDARWRLGRWSVGARESIGALFDARPLSRVRADAAAAHAWLRNADASRLLFWIGLVAGPWCWLVGGWMVAPTHADDARARVLGKLPNGGRTDLLAHDSAHNFDVEAGARKPDGAGWLSGTPRWARRCRFAAVLGGAAIIGGLLVATFVEASKR